MKKIVPFACILLVALGCGRKAESNEFEQEMSEECMDAQETFIKWIKSDTATLSMDISDRASEAFVSIKESPDGQVRVYSWVSGGGTSPSWTTYTQYRDSSGKVRCISGMPIWGEADFYTITDILVADNLGEKPIYFFEFYGKASSWEGYTTLYSSVMQADTFAIGPDFRTGTEVHDAVGIDYNIPSWYFRTNGEGWEWMHSYYPEEKQLYIPETDELELTNRYRVYEFDGKQFQFIGIKGPRNLHESLRNFQSLVQLFETEQHLVRVDRLTENRFRLAIWNEPAVARQWHAPDLVLDNGRFNEETKHVEFYLNNQLKYEYINKGDAENELRLTNNGRTVSLEKERSHRYQYQRALEYLFSDMNDSLKGFAMPLSLCITENYVVRVDSMPDGTYRYASWKKSGYPHELPGPDIVLHNGEKKCEDYYRYDYIFKNGDYRYVVPMEETAYFMVYNKDVCICKELILKSYSSEEILHPDK